MSPWLLFIPYGIGLPFAWRTLYGHMSWWYAKTNHNDERTDDNKAAGFLTGMVCAAVWPAIPIICAAGFVTGYTIFGVYLVADRLAPRIGAERQHDKAEIKQKIAKAARSSSTSGGDFAHYAALDPPEDERDRYSW